MKFYYPKDMDGNIIGFKTPESQVYDASGTSLTTKLGKKLDTDSSGYIKGLSISGKTITYTKGDGTTGTLTTQDTNTTYTLSSFGVTATAAELNILDGVTTTATELNYVDGVTSNIQTQLNGKASSSHTHSYAGSSSAGGSATSAVKLDSSAGSATQPVYFSSGKPVATTYTLGKSVPSDAKFTDTTYSNFVKSGSGAKAGLVPAPSTTAGTTKYLREDGTWVKPPNTTYSVASTSTNGLMSSTDKSKLDNMQNENLFVNCSAETTITNAATMPVLSDYGKNLLKYADTQVTLSFEAKSDVATNVDCYPRDGSDGALTSITGITSVTTSWKRHSIVLSIPAGDYSKFTIRSNSSVSGGSATAVVTIRNIELRASRTASISEIKAAAGSKISSVGTPSVTASTSGTTTTFTFNYLKGAKGDKGDTGATGPQGPKGDTGATGATPTIKVAAGSSIGSVGTPSVTASTSGTTTTFTFNYLKGAKGDKGDTGATGATGPQGPQGPAGSNANVTGGASTIATSNLTTSRALISNSSGKVAVSAVTSTELGYLSGVTGVKNGTASTSTTYGTGDKHLVNSAFLSYWNGAYSTNGASNLAYCNKGAFGDAATKSVTTSATSGSTALITSGAVYSGLAGKAASSHSHSTLEASSYSAAMQDDGNFVVYKKSDNSAIFASQNVMNLLSTTTPGTSSFKKIQASTTDLTAGSSALTTGTVYLVYE